MSENREKATRAAMEHLRRAWQEKNNQKIAARTGIESAQREMDEIMEEIRSTLNVQSIDELRKKYVEGLEENERLVRQLQEALDRCEEMQRALEETAE